MKNVLPFLKKIAKNNNTVWMQAHKEEYLVAKVEFEFLVQEVALRLHEFDQHLPLFGPKECTFRFNRDTRFSENKNPYKENFGAWFSYGGKKSGMPGYYLHVAPKEIFVAAGVWHPEADKLLKIRRYIASKGADLEKINRKTSLDRGEELKRPPRGFLSDDPFMDLIRLKNFTTSKVIALEEVTRPSFGKVLEKNFKQMKPLNDFLFMALK